MYGQCTEPWFFEMKYDMIAGHEAGARVSLESFFEMKYDMIGNGTSWNL